MGVGAGFYMYVVVVQKFTFAISSPDEFLFCTSAHCCCDKQKENVVMAFYTYLQCRQSYKYFRFLRPYCYFRLSVVIAIIWEHFHWTHHCRKPEIYRWNFDAIYHNSTDISTSGLGSHIATSGCRLLSQLFGNTFLSPLYDRKVTLCEYNYNSTYSGSD